MDPLSAVALAASVVQLADLGAKLSVKLFNISKQVKNASARYEAISQEVGSTNAVVQQLSTLLNDDNSRQLFGKAALQTTANSIAACDELFRTLHEDITPKVEADSSSIAKALAEWKHRLTLPYKQTELVNKQLKLGHLKATLTLNLNVIVLATQVRLHDHSNEGKALLLEQREAVQSLQLTIQQWERDALPEVKNELSATAEVAFEVNPGNLTQSASLGQARLASEDSHLAAATGVRSNMVSEDLPGIPVVITAEGSHIDQETQSVPSTPSGPSSTRGNSPKPKVMMGPIEKDRIRFKAHAILIQEILALIGRHRDSLQRKIETDMCYGTLGLHHTFWTRLGHDYCFDELLPHISDCEEVVS